MYNLFIDSSSANLRVSANDSNRDYKRRSIGILRAHACVRVRGQNTVTSARCVSPANASGAWEKFAKAERRWTRAFEESVIQK